VFRRLLKKRIGLPYPLLFSRIRHLVDEIANTAPLQIILVSLIVLFEFHLLLIERMDIALNPPGFMPPQAPVLMGSYFDFLKGLHSYQRHLFDLCGVLIASLETAAVYLLYRRIEVQPKNRLHQLFLICSVVLLYGMAITARANCSSDVYGYISSAKYGITAYSALPHAAFTGNFAMLDDIDRKAWKVLAPCPYGPLWLAMSYEALARVTSVWQAIVIERSLSAVFVLICGWAIWRIKSSFAAGVLFVMNPMVLFNFVVEAHNDVMGLACILMAAVTFQRPLIGALWQVAAGLIKLPYLCIGILAAQVQRSLWVRLGAFSLALLMTCCISGLFGGMDYVHALLYHVHKNSQQHHLQSETAHVVLLVISVVALMLAAFWRNYFVEAPPAFLALAATIYPWYIGLAIPYFIIGDVAPIAYLATLPMSSLFIDVLLGTKFVKILLIAIVGSALYIARGDVKADSANAYLPVVAIKT